MEGAIQIKCIIIMNKVQTHAFPYRLFDLETLTESWTWSESGTWSGETPLSMEQASVSASDWLI